MKLLFYFGHPAQYLFLRATIKNLMSKHHIKIVIKSKDVLESLVKSDGFHYYNILPKKRGNSKYAILISLIKRVLKLIPLIVSFKPDIMISTDASIVLTGKIFKIKRITITEDDYSIVKKLADLSYPYTNTILCPSICDVGKWNNKKIGYEGYMKLGYLHPNIFNPDSDILEKYKISHKYAIIRLAKLVAFHDDGIKGIAENLLDRIIEILLLKNINIYISNEGDIDEKYNKYLLNINPSDMHHILAYSTLLICDSQSMSVEASMIGVPSVRYSSFVGRISVLEELENKYQLTFGVKEGDEAKLLDTIDNLLSMDKLNEVFQERRKKMLSDKIDVTAFLIWFIENYPKSDKIMKENPDYQFNFK